MIFLSGPHPGLPYRERGFKSKRDAIADPHNRKMIRWFWHSVKHGKSITPSDCCAFVRSHLTDSTDKVRAVWGYPMAMTLGEAMFAVPLIEAYKERITCPFAYGLETAVGGMKKIISETQFYKHFTAIDFKNFDKPIHPRFIKTAFNILMRNVDFINYRNYGVAAAWKNIKMWQFIENYFINTPVRLSNGERYMNCGVASGSYFTQLIDSIINHILITYIYLVQTGRPPAYLKVMGDDSIAADNRSIDLDWASQLMETFGMTLNLHKSAVSTDINKLKFLGFEFNYGFPLKSFDEWVSLLLLPEGFDKTWDDVATRALGQGQGDI